MTLNLDRFPRYTAFDPLLPVWCITPGEGRVIHRFFDTSPVSPSGRYVALTRLPYEDRPPGPGDAAEVVLVDLESGDERVVAETRGWDTQLGAQAQWGADDRTLLFNDVDTETWQAFAVKLDCESGVAARLSGPVYMVSPDGRMLASPCLAKTGITQAGYGVIVPPERQPTNRGAPADDGITVTDVETGASRLLVSIAEIVETAEPAFDADAYTDGGFYGFHVKWNPRGDRLMFVLRFKSDSGGPLRHHVVTLRADGTEIRQAVPTALWSRGGHHPNWCPDGDTILMNLRLDGETMRFVRIPAEGGEVEVLAERLFGSGHPSMHPDGRHIVTDVYLGRPLAFGDGTIPLRWIDVPEQVDRTLVRIRTQPEFIGPHGMLRVDPHPAWDRSHRTITFNACPDGTRRVFIADLDEVIE